MAANLLDREFYTAIIREHTENACIATELQASSLPRWDRHLVVVRQLLCLHNPESYANRSLVLLAGSPMKDRSEGRGQTRVIPLVLQVCARSATLPHNPSIRSDEGLTLETSAL